ncbi:MAG: NAD(P)/FAD-dependent oxidoreductase [Thermodesulfobacteriota bacterium]
MDRKRVLILGAGFAGLNVAKRLGNRDGIAVELVDRKNHHLFQPLLYQVATGGLNPADIAMPIRSILAGYQNIGVLLAEVRSFDLAARSVETSIGRLGYDYLVVACGAQHTYFAHSEWEEHAPGLKTLEQATEIRRRILTAYEKAEGEPDPAIRKKLLTFVVVGGGATGVEIAGAIGEMSRYTLVKDFRNIDPKLTRIMLVEGGPRILPAFTAEQASRATRDLESLGVQVWTSSMVTRLDAGGVEIMNERIEAGTVLWAAGIKASELGRRLGADLDASGRVLVEPDLSIKGHPEVFVAGDLANFSHQTGGPLPALAPVALQQGRFIARTIVAEQKGESRRPFRYLDKGQLATIGRSKAVLEIGRIRLSGALAWMAWLLVHIFYLTGFRNRVFVILQWAWSFLTLRRGARLIVGKQWRFYNGQPKKGCPDP